MSTTTSRTTRSDIYMNEGNEWLINHPRLDVTMNNTRENNTRGMIEYVKNLVKIKTVIYRIKTFLYINTLILCFSSVVIISLLVSFGIITKHSCVNAVQNEDQEIKNFLKKLYKDCKDNPLNFDWTAQIFRRIEEAERKIYEKLVAYEIPSTLDNLVSAISEYCDGTPTAAKFYLTIDRGRGIRFAGNSQLLLLDQDEASQNDNDLTKRKKKRTPKPRPTSRWYRPTGMPGTV